MLVISVRSHSAVREGKREMLEAEPLMACAAAAHAIYNQTKVSKISPQNLHLCLRDLVVFFGRATAESNNAVMRDSTKRRRQPPPNN